MVNTHVINYVQCKRNARDYFKLDIKALEQKNHRKLYDRLKEDIEFIELDFADTPDKLKEYLDMHDGVWSEVFHTTKFVENSDLNKTYFGRIDMTSSDKIKVEERFSISEQGYMVRKFVDSTEYQILLDTGASKSLMSKTHYLRCKSLH